VLPNKNIAQDTKQYIIGTSVSKDQRGESAAKILVLVYQISIRTILTELNKFPRIFSFKFQHQNIYLLSLTLSATPLTLGGAV
jgi:hypothetical protein